MPWQRWEPTGRRDSGAVAVETAAVSMFLVILLFGIVESSFLFKDWLSVSAAARAGARMGASEPRTSSFAQDSADQVTASLSDLNPANLQEVWVYRTTGTTGLPDSGSFASCTTCVKFTWNATTGSLMRSSDNWPSTSQNACAGDATRDSLGVYVKYRHTSPLGFFFNNATISESTVMWVEPTSSAICKPA
jgi:Flp pilus assembly protein TadG